MAAIISGIVFNDLDHSGVITGSDPGIPNAFVVLRDPSGTCTNTQTDATGNYSFTNLNTAGTYTIYETVANPGATCPPTTFTQPSGFNGSTTARVLTVTVTATDITNNTDLSGNNFGHDNLESFQCTSFAYLLGIPGGSTPPTSRLFRLDLKTGNTVDLGRVNQPSTATSALNGFGYNSKDGNFYGYNPNANGVFRLTKDLTITSFTIPNLPVPNLYTVGDVDPNGYLYIYRGTTEIFVIDVDPNRATYMKLVDPANSFQEDTAPFGLPISQVLSIGDFSFNPQDGQLYTVLFGGTSGGVFKINPLSGAVTTLTVNPSPVVGNYGGTFFDNYNNLYASDNNTTEVFKYVLSPTPNPTTATRSLFSTTGRTTNDGARCAGAPINFADLSFVKSATPYAKVGDILTYTIVANNIGNDTASNVIFVDTMPIGTSFISSSLTLDSNTISGSPVPPSGVNLGDLSIGAHTITFNVTVVSVPNPNPTPNSAVFNYSFTDNSIVFANTILTNIVSTTIVSVSISSFKSVDKPFARVGETLTYTITINNSGTTALSSLTFIDTIPNNTTFVPNSLTQDSIPVSGSPNPPGATLPNAISPGSISSVTFSVVINSLPPSYTIANTSSTSYNYIVNPALGAQTDLVSSNFVTTTVNFYDLSQITKTVNGVSNNYATIGDVLTYTITVPNNGNDTASSVTFVDTIPTNTSFIPQSVIVNNVPNLVTVPQNNVLIINSGSLGVGSIATLSFRVVVTTIPTPNPISNRSSVSYLGGSATNSNAVTTTVSFASISSSKIVNKTFARVGDILVYTIPITNSGNTTLTSVLFIDTIPSGTSLVPNSFNQDNTPISGTPNPPGVILPNNISGPGVSTISFSVVINTIPNPNPIPNSASATGSYLIDPTSVPQRNGSSSSNTNIVNTQVNTASLTGITKFVDKVFVTCGDIITYSISIPNSGNITANNVILSDTVPNGTVFVSNSILVNGLPSSATSPTSIPLGTINPGATATVSFSVRVQC